MELSDHLLCLFSARIDERDDEYVVEVPDHELDLGELETDEVYRIAVLQSHDSTMTGAQSHPSGGTDDHPAPPVTQGEVRDVEIEDIGDQGDGIARVERGFVIIVPEASRGETVTVEITNVAENYAIGTIVEDDDASEFDPTELT